MFSIHVRDLFYVWVVAEAPAFVCVRRGPSVARRRPSLVLLFPGDPTPVVVVPPQGIS